jgi:hypothetical protein
MMPRLVLLSAILLGGCTLGPDYVRPELPKADVFPEAGKGGAAVRAEWWKSLGDPELDALVAKALVANADLRIAVGRVEQAAAVLGETEGAGLPQIDAAGGITATSTTDGRVSVSFPAGTTFPAGTELTTTSVAGATAFTISGAVLPPGETKSMTFPTRLWVNYATSDSAVSIVGVQASVDVFNESARARG